jgi:hypothetical protein
MALNKRMTGLDTPNDPGVGPGLILTGGAQTVDPTSRWIVVSTAGTITGQLVGDTVDVAYVLPVGVWKMAFKSVTSTTSLVGVLLR